MRISFLLLLFTFGCDAIFTDLSPEGTFLDMDVSIAMDSSAPDTSPALDAGSAVDVGLDAGPEPDSGPTAMDAAPSTLLGTGTFEGRGGYPAAGSVRLEQVSAGEYQVVMSDDFSSAAVPGPIIVITPRATIGTERTSVDLVVASLSAEQIAGPGTYSFSALSVPSDAFIFIYCDPFGVETASAQLVAP